MKININYKKYFYFLKKNKELKNHYLIEDNFLNSKKIIFDILKILICKKNGECLEECYECNLINKKDLDYLFIFDIKNSNQTEEIKKLIFWSLFKSNIEKKYFWIPESELLTNISSNKLLKFLEENSNNIVGFFTTNFKEKMLPTVLSRLIDLKFFKKKIIDIFSEDEKIILDQINFKFNDCSNEEIKIKLNICEEIVFEFLNKIEEKKVDEFLFFSDEKFLLENFWLFIEILLIKIYKKKTLNQKWIKIIKIIMEIISKNRKLFKISNNNLSTKINLIKLIEDIKFVNK